MKKISVKKQIISIFLLAVILPVLILGFISTYQIHKQMTQQYESLLQADAMRVNSILQDITLSIYTAGDTIIFGTEPMTLFGSEYKDNSQNTVYYEQMSAALDALYQHNAAIADVHIYTNNASLPENAYITHVNDFLSESWFGHLAENNWRSWTCLSSKDWLKNDLYQLALIRRIGIPSEDYRAYMIVTLDNNYIKNRIGQTNYEIVAAVGSLPVFFSTNSSRIQNSMPVPDTTKTLSYQTGFQSYKTNNRFQVLLIDNTAKVNIQRITFTYLFIILIVTLVPSIIMLAFSSYLTNRITTLKSAMHRASEGDYNILEDFRGNDELGETFQDLKTTVETIRQKEILYYEEQLAKQQLINRQQQTEFKLLATQINPHFLYNTLETIRMQALASGNRNVATSIKLLGKTMHYVLENTGTEFTTLDKELDYIKSYLSIQQLRFRERVHYNFQIEPDVQPQNYPILPLLLQPVVENAISHGLESVDQNGFITISAHLAEQFLILAVQDNGCGISPERLAELEEQSSIPEKEGHKSIGLYNIRQRLFLCYGERAELSIDSTVGIGTTVTLRLPLNRQNQESLRRI